MAETVTLFLEQYFSAKLVVFLISMMPILELRGGLIAASLLGIPWQEAALICIAGTIIPVPFILFFIRAILGFLQKTKLFGKIANYFEKKALSKGSAMMEKYPRRVQLGLFLFVAIPLPGTGAWTGSLIAAVLRIPIKYSMPAILAGAVGSAVIMLGLTYLIPSFIIG